MSNSFRITTDEWLAGILGRPVFRFDIESDFAQLHFERMADPRRDIDSAMAIPHVFIYTRVSPLQSRWVSFLEYLGFHLADTNVLLSKPCVQHGHGIKGGRCRFAAVDDQIETMDIARRAFIFSRFHQDPAFGRETADHIKASWAGNYYKGKRGDYMVVAVVDSRVVGFLQLLIRQKDLVIDLIAVDEPYRRQGIACQMIEFAESNCGNYGCIYVGTQIANTASLQAYERMGFRFQSANYVFHYHGS
jgi:GNAT superfamily N-acetyltransferase